MCTASYSCYYCVNNVCNKDINAWLSVVVVFQVEYFVFLQLRHAPCLLETFFFICHNLNDAKVTRSNINQLPAVMCSEIWLKHSLILSHVPYLLIITLPVQLSLLLKIIWVAHPSSGSFTHFTHVMFRWIPIHYGYGCLLSYYPTITKKVLPLLIIGDYFITSAPEVISLTGQVLSENVILLKLCRCFLAAWSQCHSCW